MAGDDVRAVLASRRAKLTGRALSDEEVSTVRAALGAAIPDAWLSMLQEFPVVGMDISLDESRDPGGAGLSVRVLGPKNLLIEAQSAYPGKLALPMGLVPFAKDLTGGEPLFLSFGPVWQTVEVSHDACNLEKEVIEPWGVRPYMALAELLKIADLG